MIKAPVPSEDPGSKNGQNYLSRHDFSLPVEEFRRSHFLVFDGLIKEGVLRKLALSLENCPFKPVDYDVGSELGPQRDFEMAILNFILNDDAVLRQFRRLSGAENVRYFRGRIYKMLPDEPSHNFIWHDDRDQRNRIIGLSLNLSRSGFEGGEFQMRKNHEVIVNFRNDRFGQLFVFPIAPSFTHRVTPVTGEKPKLSFAGWFYE